MAKSLIIDIFEPPSFKKAPLTIEKLNSYLLHKCEYASAGRWALFHCLKSLNITGKILLPAYICNSILEPIRLLSLEPVFYDLDPDDLNADFSSIRSMIKNNNAHALLIASMYGNPANLIEIESLCKEKGIVLIDDAAQSFGASLGDKPVGSFGDAGFFSFSPGKPLAGHMGAFYWTNNEAYIYERKRHTFYHLLSYINYYVNRLYIYKYRSIYPLKILSLLRHNLLKVINIKNDARSGFENKIIGGIINSFFTGNYNFRKKFHREFLSLFKENKYFKCITNVRGESSPYKIVIICKNREITSHLLTYLKSARIFCMRGYTPIARDTESLPSVASIDQRVVELSIENDERKMTYLFSVLSQFQNQEKYEKNPLCSGNSSRSYKNGSTYFNNEKEKRDI